MPLSKTNPKRRKPKTNAARPWKGARSKPSGTTAKAKAATPVKPEVLKIPVEKRAEKLTELLKDHYPAAQCSLDFKNPLQLLIATMLSAQCTDERVNKVTPALFARYPTVKDFAGADQAELEGLIRSTGFYRNKAKNIIGCCQKLLGEHGGEIPKTMEELSALPGVGRKTANVVLGNAFGIPGVVVDTHVTRLSHRLGLAQGKNPEEIERELEKIFPRETWIDLAHWLIFHGRAICTARKPLCAQCFLLRLCPQIL
jgi:endonuclease-3